jgi:hypothetical protein|tara:strand:+ start:144 stop:788 length:645 start_codon:yes stop_codon:yes gene_type:complete
MNTTETNLIFEAYAKSKPLNEGSFWGQKEMVDDARAEEDARGMVRLKKEPIPGRYHGKTVHKSKVQALLDDGWELADKVDSEDAEDYGTAYEDLPLEDLFDTALEAVDKGHGLIESLMLSGATESNIDELFELFKEYVAEQQKEFGSPEDNENYASEGAANLLEQLREEAPELEDKINQILGKVHDVVDILKHESYADDPQLVKAYASLIEGNY